MNTPSIDPEKIAAAAYYRRLASGTPEGTELRSWLDAEAAFYERASRAPREPAELLKA